MSAATHPTPAGLRRALSALQLICVIGTVTSFRAEAVVYFVRTNGNNALGLTRFDGHLQRGGAHGCFSLVGVQSPQGI